MSWLSKSLVIVRTFKWLNVTQSNSKYQILLNRLLIDFSDETLHNLFNIVCS